MTNQTDDCYFFYYSKCIKGDLCPFRHEPAALGKEQVCAAWSNGACTRVGCPDRHMIINRNRTQTPCFWESQPGGCQKPHCVFFHRKPTQTPQRVVAVPTAPVIKTSTPAEEMKETMNNTTPVVNQKMAAVQKAPVAPKPVVAVEAVQAPLPVKPAKGLETPALDQRRSDNRKVVTSVNGVNGVVSPKKVVVQKEEQPLKSVKDRLRGRIDCVESSSKSSLEFGVKTLEQIHREKALASMKKKHDDRTQPSSSNSSLEQADLTSAGRKIVLISGRTSEGEISELCNSPGRKVEVTTSDTENGRVKGNVKGRLGPMVGELTPPQSGDSSPGDRVSNGKVIREILLVKPLAITAHSPQKRLRKRKPESEIVHRLQSASKVQKVATAKKQVKPAMEIYRPPRSANSTVEPRRDLPPASIIKKLTKPEAVESTKVGKKAESTAVPQESPDRKPASTLLKKPLLNDNKQKDRRPLEKVRVKTLDEILAEKRKTKSPDRVAGNAPVDLPAQVASSSAVNVRSTVEKKRRLARKRSSEDSIDDCPQVSDSKHSALGLLKRRKLSIDCRKNRPVDNGQSSSSEEILREETFEWTSSDLPVAEEKQKAPCYDRKESMSLDVDSLLDDDFLLGDPCDSFATKTINDDDQLFSEIQSLLE